MREGKIILPVEGNKGEDISAAHVWLTRMLIRYFGGLTVQDARGSWLDQGRVYTEDVKVYVVAGSSRNQLRRYALKAGCEAGQKSIYWVDFDGNVHIEEVY